MCKTMDEVTETIRTLKLTIKALEIEIACLRQAQCGGCKMRTQACEEQCNITGEKNDTTHI